MKHFILTVLPLFIVLLAYNQDWNAVFSYELDAEYFISEGDFDQAAESYLKALDIVPNSFNLKFKAGFCFLKTSTQKDRAMALLKDASDNITKSYDNRSLHELKAPSEALYHLGVAYMHERLFDLAIDCFNRYKEMYDNNDTYVVALVEHRIQSCNKAKQVLALDDEYLINASQIDVNHNYPNSSMVISGDGSTMAYTSRTEVGNEVFVTKLVDGGWIEPTNITRRLGSKLLHTSFISFDGTELYLVEEDFNGSKLVYSTLTKNKWSKVSDFPKPISSKFNEGHICATSDGQTVYFTSDRKGGFGGFDIYKSVKENGKWGKAQNLGEKINSPLDEKTPFLTADDRYLFFSSEGGDGIGGHDIYYVDLQDASQNVINLGTPLNTPDDDFFYYPITLNEGYYAFLNKNGSDHIDIFRIEMLPLYDATFNVQLASADMNDKNYDVSILNKHNNNVLKEVQGKGNNQIKLLLPSGTYTFKAVGPDIEQAFAELEIPKGSNKIPFSKTIVLSKIQEPEVIAISEVDIPAVIEPTAETELIVQSSVNEFRSSEIKETEEKTLVVEPEVSLAIKPKAIPKPKQSVAVFDVSLEETEACQITYSVQLFASEQPADIQFISPFDSIDVTISPSGYYRYSIGKTTSVSEVESWVTAVKAKGYKNAYVRINRETPGFTIQVMALSIPRSLAFFSDISGVMVSRSARGLYRYCVGKFKTKVEAQAELSRLHDMGYQGAFVREL